jgi:hypothetical protein
MLGTPKKKPNLKNRLGLVFKQILICINRSNSWRLAWLSVWRKSLDAVACSKDLARSKEQEQHSKERVLVHHSKELDPTLRYFGSLLVRQCKSVEQRFHKSRIQHYP